MIIDNCEKVMKEIKVPFLGCNEFALSVGCNDFALGVGMIILFYKIKSESGGACRWGVCVVTPQE